MSLSIGIHTSCIYTPKPKEREYINIDGRLWVVMSLKGLKMIYNKTTMATDKQFKTSSIMMLKGDRERERLLYDRRENKKRGFICYLVQ